MFTIKDWYDKPAEITKDNFYKQSFDVYKDDVRLFHISAGDCCFDEIKAYFEGNFETALEITLNNKAAMQLSRGLSALQQLRGLGIREWGTTTEVVEAIAEVLSL